MKFKCLKKEIQNVIAITEDIVEGKIVYNIESNVVFDLKGNILTLMATNNNIWVRGEIELSECEGEGMVAVLAKKVGSIIKEMPEGYLNISVDDSSKINISNESGKIRHSMIGIQPEDFPMQPQMPDNTVSIELPAKEIITMVNKTIGCVARDSLKPVLRGIYFEKEASGFKAVSTDGKRLTYIEREFEAMEGDDFQIIVEPKVLSEIINVINYDDVQSVSLSVGPQQAYFKCGRFTFVSTLIEGKFPNFYQVIPQSFDYSFRVNKNDLLDAIRRVSPMINEDKSRRMVFEVYENSLRIKAVNKEMGESIEEIEANYHGEEHSLVLNFTFLQDIVKNLDSEIITIRANESIMPAMVKEIERDDYFFIVMPMSIDE